MLYLDCIYRTIDITPWPESVSELSQPSERRLSTKLVPIFVGGGVSSSQRGGFPTAVFYMEPLLSSSSSVGLTRLSGPRSRSTTSQ
jgi:hypothetical protein